MPIQAALIHAIAAKKEQHEERKANDKDHQLSHTKSQHGSQMVTCVAWMLEVNRQVLHPGNRLAVKYLKRLRAERREN